MSDATGGRHPGPRRSAARCSAGGRAAAEATQVSLLVPSLRLEIDHASRDRRRPGSALRAGRGSRGSGPALGVLVGHGEGADDDGPGLERPGVGHRRGGGRLDDLLAHPGPGRGPGSGRASSSSRLRRSGRRPPPGGRRRRRPHGQDDEVLEMGQHVAQSRVVAAPPGLGPPQGQLLAEQDGGERGRAARSGPGPR